MTTVPEQLKYTNTHEWVKLEADGTLTIGITEHAQALLGDLVYVQLPEVSNAVNRAQEAAVVESVKAASDVYAPVSGTIIACNDALDKTPELINQAPYDAGWIFKMQPSNLNELEQLLSAPAYHQLIHS